MARLGLISLLLGNALGQQAGYEKLERPMPLPLYVCSDLGCQAEPANATLDSNWRWLHDANGYINCYSEDGWNFDYCPDPDSCARNCAFDGVDEATYRDTYGIRSAPGGIRMEFKTEASKGSRVYVMDSPESYKLFKLKNRELAIDMDVSSLDCGINAAVYLVGMDRLGARGSGNNAAGARYGTGYCDAQCRYDMKFVDGTANMDGRFGSCCSEIDIFEGNMWSQQMALHPCDMLGPAVCTGTQCGDNANGERYMGICDKDGCDFNGWRMGAHNFYGPDGQRLDSKRPFTLVTQFVTDDGTDEGELAWVKRFFLQDGMRFDAMSDSIGNAASAEFCAQMKKAMPIKHTGQMGDFDQFTAKNGMSTLGQALDKGMVLVLSIWDDPETHMRWLDSDEPLDMDPSVPGVRRGPCPATSTEEEIQQANAYSAVTYANLRYGAIDSTQNKITQQPYMQKSEVPAVVHHARRLLPLSTPLVAVMAVLASLAAVAGRRRRRPSGMLGMVREAEVDPFIDLMAQVRQAERARQ